MKKGPLLVSALFACGIAAFATGCSDSTDVPKSLNDAYHNHDKGNQPPPNAMKPRGSSFVGKPMSVPVGGNTAPAGGGPPSGAGAPGK